MVTTTNSQRLSRSLGFDKIHIVDPQGHCGGMWVCWNQNNLDLYIVSLEHCITHLLVTNKENNKSFALFGLYAPSQEKQRSLSFGMIFAPLSNHALSLGA